MRPVHKADNLPPSCTVTKSGNLIFLEPCGPVQACNETALPLTVQIAAVNFTANIVYHPRIPNDLEFGTTKFSETWSRWVEPDDAQD